MRIAWFAPAPNDVAREFGPPDLVDAFDRRHARDFVWRHFQAPYDVTVFELADTRDHEFIWPYVFHYPGAVLLLATGLQHSRSYTLTHHRRHHHLRAERAFSGWNLLRAPLMASRAVIVHDEGMGRELDNDMPGLNLYVVPAGVAPARALTPDARYRFHVAGPRRDVVERAAMRARSAGAMVELAGIDEVRADDVIVALEWPPTGGPPIEGLRAMAAGLATIVLDSEAVAAWPTLDPQSWQRRGYHDAAPVAIAIDPRDEEHSLMLAMRRLAGDAQLRAALGNAARAWARDAANPETAAARWRHVLGQAAHLAPPVDRGGLPAHLVDDGSETARRILRQFGASVDFLG